MHRLLPPSLPLLPGHAPRAWLERTPASWARLLQEGQAEPRGNGDLAAARLIVLPAAAAGGVRVRRAAAPARQPRAQVWQLPVLGQAAAVNRAVPARQH